jgi:hypothetical protein
MISFNSAVHKSTRTTPFYATFGYDPRQPVWTTGEILETPSWNTGQTEQRTAYEQIQNSHRQVQKLIDAIQRERKQSESSNDEYSDEDDNYDSEIDEPDTEDDDDIIETALDSYNIQINMIASELEAWVSRQDHWTTEKLWKLHAIQKAFPKLGTIYTIGFPDRAPAAPGQPGPPHIVPLPPAPNPEAAPPDMDAIAGPSQPREVKKKSRKVSLKNLSERAKKIGKIFTPDKKRTPTDISPRIAPVDRHVTRSSGLPVGPGLDGQIRAGGPAAPRTTSPRPTSRTTSPHPTPPSTPKGKRKRGSPTTKDTGWSSQ